MFSVILACLLLGSITLAELPVHVDPWEAKFRFKEPGPATDVARPKLLLKPYWEVRYTVELLLLAWGRLIELGFVNIS